MRQDHRTFGSALIARQAQRHAILGREGVDDGSAHAQGALLARWSIGIEGGGACEYPAIGFKQRTCEELAKRYQGLQPFGDAGGVGDLHGGHLFGEIRKLNVQNAQARNGTGLVVLAQGDVEGAGVGPDGRDRAPVNHLEPVEVPALAFLREQRHAVAHVAGLDLVGIHHEKLEDAAIHGQGFGGKPGSQHGAGHARLVPRLGDHPVDVVAADGEGELERVEGGFTLLLASRVVGCAFRPEALHGFGELDARSGCGRRTPGLGPQRVVDGPAAVLRDQRAGSLGHRGDGERGIHAQRPRQHRAIVHIEVGVNCVASGAGENLAFMIHHAAGGVFPHHAAAQRMHADQRLRLQRMPGGVGREHTAQWRGGFFQIIVGRGEDRLATHTRPGDAQTIVLQVHAAQAVVVGHDQVRLGVVDGADIGATLQALQLTLRHGDGFVEALGLVAAERIRSGQPHGQQSADGSRNGSLFDDHALIEFRLLAQIDDAGDARTHLRAPLRIVAAEAEAIDGRIGVVAEAQHVAIAGKPLAGDGRERQALPRRAQQNFRGA